MLGPVRQFVGTETLTCTTEDVAVKAGVGDKVAVGVAVVVGVRVGVDDSAPVIGTPAWAV